MIKRAELRPKEVRSIAMKPRMAIQELKLTDLGEVKYFLVGGQRMVVLLGLQPNSFGRRFIEQTALKNYAGGKVIWPNVNKKIGLVRDSGLNDFEIIRALKGVGLKAGLPNMEEAKQIADKFQRLLLHRGIEIFRTSDFRKNADINDFHQYQSFCDVRRIKFGIIPECIRETLHKTSLVLVADE
jgi:hypothetical protein